ncbi:MAG: zinc-ribbon domain-containing protein [Firmicutes bacterium]|nr:zinc-ribbon domain-containing protein [Bacillota bacterium]
MAMIQCKNCGKDISDKAYACPHCGHSAIEEKSIGGDC